MSSENEEAGSPPVPEDTELCADDYENASEKKSGSAEECLCLDEESEEGKDEDDDFLEPSENDCCGTGEHSSQELYTGSRITTTASLSLITQVIEQHSLSKRAVYDILRVLSAHLPEQPHVLKSRFLFEKAVADLRYKSAGAVRHDLCPCCKRLMEPRNQCPTDGCQYDGTSSPLSFFELPIENQLQTLFAGTEDAMVHMLECISLQLSCVVLHLFLQ